MQTYVFHLRSRFPVEMTPVSAASAVYWV